jgi:lysyl-tRNA synthetase class I
MTIDHHEILNATLAKHLPDDRKGTTAQVWVKAALAAMAEVERLVREESAADIERLRQIIEIAAEWLRDYKISHAHNAELNGRRAATLELLFIAKPQEASK